LKSAGEINFFVSTVTFSNTDFAPVKTVVQKSVSNNCWRYYLSAVVVHVDENFLPSKERTRERAFEERAMRERDQ